MRGEVFFRKVQILGTPSHGRRALNVGKMLSPSWVDVKITRTASMDGEVITLTIEEVK